MPFALSAATAEQGLSIGTINVVGVEPRRQARPLVGEDVRRIVAPIDPGTAAGAGDRALILIGFVSALHVVDADEWAATAEMSDHSQRRHDRDLGLSGVVMSRRQARVMTASIRCGPGAATASRNWSYSSSTVVARLATTPLPVASATKSSAGSAVKR